MKQRYEHCWDIPEGEYMSKYFSVIEERENEGWELVTIGSGVAFFKRPFVEDPAVLIKRIQDELERIKEKQPDWLHVHVPAGGEPKQPTISELAEPVLKTMESEGFTFTKQKVDKAEDLQMEVERNQPCQECERLREGIKVLRALFPEKDMIADREFEALLNPHNVLGPEEKE